ncbi:hypothetical protein [Burkholderia ubonensis]|uniref:hypothetical protein n=1 Tax=Burkholderia ubonensis TaxID=101571 RepID=UPI000A9BE0B9|nr:hypothetical protein [Burkholderia ubonensis]
MKNDQLFDRGALVAGERLLPNLGSFVKVLGILPIYRVPMYLGDVCPEGCG